MDLKCSIIHKHSFFFFAFVLVPIPKCAAQKFAEEGVKRDTSLLAFLSGVPSAARAHGDGARERTGQCVVGWSRASRVICGGVWVGVRDVSL